MLGNFLDVLLLILVSKCYCESFVPAFLWLLDADIFLISWIYFCKEGPYVMSGFRVKRIVNYLLVA